MKFLNLKSLISQADPGSPADGDVWNSSARNALSVRMSGQTEDLSSSLWRNETLVSFGNTTTETSLLADAGVGTKTIAANRLKLGNHIRVKAAGLYGASASPPNLTVRLKLGGTTIRTIGPFAPPASVVDQSWWLEAEIAVDDTGASGLLRATLVFFQVDGSGNVKGRTFVENSGSLDTTQARIVDVTAQYSAAGSGNFMDTITSSIELLA